MIKKCFITMLSASLAFSGTLEVSIDNNISKEALSVVSNRNMLSEMKVLEERVFFANEYLKDLSQKEKDIIKYEVIENLYNFKIKDIMEKEKFSLSNEVLQSYYLVHKDKYKQPLSVDFTMFTFTNEKDAKAYKLNDKKIKPISQKDYKNISFEALTPNTLLSISNLKENTLSDVLKLNGEFIRIIFIKKEAKTLSFEEAKPKIMNDLVSEKKQEIIKAYKK